MLFQFAKESSLYLPGTNQLKAPRSECVVTNEALFELLRVPLHCLEQILLSSLINCSDRGAESKAPSKGTIYMKIPRICEWLRRGGHCRTYKRE
jgi:hypothetical protein